MRPCRRFEQALIVLAEGGEAPEAAAHLDQCEGCTRRLAEYRHLLGEGGIAKATQNAPAEWIARAAAIFPEARRAAVLRHSLSQVGARLRDTDTLQIAYEVDGVVLRVQYARLGSGWQVTGRVLDLAWTVQHRGASVPLDPEGGFQIDVRETADTGFDLVLPSGRVAIPGVAEALGEPV